jgi:hypothetical protein
MTSISVQPLTLKRRSFGEAGKGGACARQRLPGAADQLLPTRGTPSLPIEPRRLRIAAALARDRRSIPHVGRRAADRPGSASSTCEMKVEAACGSDGDGPAPWSNHEVFAVPIKAEPNCSSVPQSCGAAPGALADQLLDFDAQLVQAFTRAFTAPDKELAALNPHTRLYAALAHVVALLGGPGINLSARPSNIDDSSTLPALYREQRLKRRYARARDVRMDMWKPHGGTSTRRLRLPDSLLEDGSEAQNLVRRSGKIVRPNGLPPLRYRQYELVAAVVDGVPPPPSQRPSTVAVFHVLPSAVGTVAPKKITDAEAAAAT